MGIVALAWPYSPLRPSYSKCSSKRLPQLMRKSLAGKTKKVQLLDTKSLPATVLYRCPFLSCLLACVVVLFCIVHQIGEVRQQSEKSFTPPYFCLFLLFLDVSCHIALVRHLCRIQVWFYSYSYDDSCSLEMITTTQWKCTFFCLIPSSRDTSESIHRPGIMTYACARSCMDANGTQMEPKVSILWLYGRFC